MQGFLEKAASGGRRISGWDGKIILAGLFTIGFFATLMAAMMQEIPEANLQVIIPAITGIVGVLGVMFGAIYRSSRADNEREVTMAATASQNALLTNQASFKTALGTAAAFTGQGAYANAADPSSDQHQRVEDAAEEGAYRGAEEAIEEQQVAAAETGARRDEYGDPKIPTMFPGELLEFSPADDMMPADDDDEARGRIPVPSNIPDFSGDVE